MNGYLLLVRVLMSAVFLFSGFDKLFDWAEAQREVVGFGLPMPVFFAAATIVVQLGGGLSVLLGFYTRLGSLLLMAFTAAATLLVHWPVGAPNPTMALTTSLEHLAIIGGFVLLMVTGPGTLALDGRR